MRALLLAVALLIAALGCGDSPSGEAGPESANQADEAEREKWTVWSQAEEQWKTMELAEDLIIDLTPKIARLDDSVFNLQLPDQPKRDVFAAQVSVRDLSREQTPVAEPGFAALAVDRLSWPVGEASQTTPQQLDLWRPFLDTVDYFDAAFFKIKSGSFPELSRDSFSSYVAFTGRARLESGELVSIQSSADVVWRNVAADDAQAEEADWRISEWKTKHFEIQGSSTPLFEEVLGSVLPNTSLLERARDSIHERYVIDYILHPDEFEPPNPYFTVPSEDFHPGIAVVDLDRDGFDDFYVMARWGPNMFFRNTGDGRFEEIAAELGLDITDHSSAAVFADFDNDGDADLMLGRSLERGMLLMNEDGRFVDHSVEGVSEPLPYFTSSVSAVDYDGDGLLDLYLSTYMKVLMIRDFVARQGRIEDGMLKEFLPLADAKRLAELRMAPDFQQFLNHPGPPNMLLRNVGGGRFKVVHDVPELRIFRNTFQSTWGDYDGDGDPDVYVANDFGPNNLVRNDGGGRFTDVTGDTETADIGFGMGASWGDYDNDGNSDLYVSNMYSTAGNRILKQLDHVDGTFLGAARGNTLFRNASDSFEKVSGVEAPALTVEKAGWSWGGQFADFDNDGFEDIYALSGYYTAAKEVAIERDT